MLLLLAEYLQQFHKGFAVFQYLTLRGMLGVLTALALALWLGPWMIRTLQLRQIGQAVRTDGPQSHLSKKGTPTMGGALILSAIAISTLLWADLSNRYVWVVLAVTLLFGAIGWVDDYRKVIEKNSRGLPSRWKYFWQSVFGLGAAVFLYATAENPIETTFILPFIKDAVLPLGLGFIVLTYFVIVGSSNAVNLTDGLDGLAIMPTVLVGGALGIFCYLSGHANFAQYLLIPYVPGAGELIVFCSAMIGAGLGFLWRPDGRQPAQGRLRGQCLRPQRRRAGQGAAVDHQRAFGQVRQQAIVAQVERFHVPASRQHRDHHLRALGGGAGRCGGAHARLAHLGQRVGAEVEGIDRVAGLVQVDGHRAAHVTQADEGDAGGGVAHAGLLA